MAHPCHDITYGKKAPWEVQAIIEVPKDCSLKYELDKESGLMRLDRALYSAVYYPGDYGFIPRTYWEDSDPLDILIISNFSTYPGTIVNARPIGIIDMYDGSERDDKIIAVHASDPRFKDFRTLKDVPEHMLLEIKHFFETYKQLQKKKVKVLNFKGVEAAHKCIRRGIKLYEKEFGKKK